MNKIIVTIILVACAGLFNFKASAQGTIEVTGAATVSITPDRITVEIAVEEFYRKKSATDSVKVDIVSLEKDVRRALGCGPAFNEPARLPFLRLWTGAPVRSPPCDCGGG